jgi:hypothetical protein
VKGTLISLGDVVHAVAALAPDAEALDRILSMLGLLETPAVHVPAQLGPWQSSSSENVSVAQRSAPAPAPSEPPAPPASEAPAPTRAAGGSAVGAFTVRRVRQGTGNFVQPAWVERGERLDPYAASGADDGSPPLFPLRTRRAVLTAALSTRVPEGEVEVERIVDVLSSRRPVHRLPRRPVPTLRRGAQVLIDTAEGMDPFRSDQDALVRALDDVLADDRLEVLRFRHCPSRGTGSGPTDGWGPWTPPTPGTPVVLLTDFGIGGSAAAPARARAGEWLAFARRARAAGCPLTGFVPYQASRWPARLARVVTMIHWSERTTAGQVARAVRGA